MAAPAFPVLLPQALTCSNRGVAAFSAGNFSLPRFSVLARRGARFPAQLALRNRAECHERYPASPWQRVHSPVAARATPAVSARLPHLSPLGFRPAAACLCRAGPVAIRVLPALRRTDGRVAWLGLLVLGCRGGWRGCATKPVWRMVGALSIAGWYGVVVEGV